MPLPTSPDFSGIDGFSVLFRLVVITGYFESECLFVNWLRLHGLIIHLMFFLDILLKPKRCTKLGNEPQDRDEIIDIAGSKVCLMPS